MEMPTGTIKKLVADRGFGFIAAEDGKEFFFHRSGTEGDFDRLQGGEKVTFEPEGPAREVRSHGLRFRPEMKPWGVNPRGFFSVQGTSLGAPVYWPAAGTT